MSGMRTAFEVYTDEKLGVVVPDEVAHQIAGAVHAVLSAHMDELVAVDWTYNITYRMDGEQVICTYPDRRGFSPREERVSEMLAAESLHIRRTKYTDEEDPEKVTEMCAMVARGEMGVEP